MAGKQAPQAYSRHAWDPALLETREISDIKAIAAQHPIGFAAIVHKICRLTEVSFAAGGEDGRRETDYAEGKRAVGANLLTIVAIKMPGPSEKAAEPKS